MQGTGTEGPDRPGGGTGEAGRPPTTRPRLTRRRVIGGMAVAAALGGGLTGSRALGGGADATPFDGRDRIPANPPGAPPGWTATWGTAMSDVTGPPVPSGGWTVRHVVRVSVGGDRVRVLLSNLFGERRAVFGHVTVRLSGEAGPPVDLAFSGRRSCELPPGAFRYSDPAPLAVPTGAYLAVDIHVARSPRAVTRHGAAFRRSRIAPGDRAGQDGLGGFTGSTTSWLFLTEVAVAAPGSPGAVVAFGDSITDGATSTFGTDRRWPDYLARRLAQLPPPGQLGVVNAGILGNRLLDTGDSAMAPGVARAALDITARAGVRSVILLLGVNDLRGGPPSARELWSGYERIAATARERSVRVLGGTLLPCGGSTGWSPERERVRAEINSWMRQGRLSDGVVDFDAAVRDPADPSRMLPGYRSPDFLHPVDAGFRAMADAVPLALL